MKSTPEELAAKIKALSPANQLRLAADMLDVNKPKIALIIAAHVVDALTARDTWRWLKMKGWIRDIASAALLVILMFLALLAGGLAK